MKEFLKKYSLWLAIIAAIIFLVFFLSFIFHKVGDDVYVVAVTGTVNVGTTSDVANLKTASVGMKLTTNDIVVTGDKSSCVLSYNKEANDKDNFVNISENSQVMLYDRNSQGGYKFFVTYGSVICNMPVDRSYRTNISTKLFNLFTDGTITKVSYDDEASIGKVFTFDGNPRLQIIQPSGATNAAEKLLKNSVCAVSKMDDGTIGFGSLNVGFGLNALTAQDLKTMSGVANAWAEKIAYGVNEFEQAFQTASDYAKWTVTEPVAIHLTEEVTEQVINSDNTYAETTVPDTVVADESITVETTVETKYTGATQTVPEEFRDDSNESADKSNTNNTSLPITVFTRQTVIDLGDEDSGVHLVTTVPDGMTDNDESVSGTETKRPAETEPYSKETTTNGSKETSGNNTSTTKPSSSVTTKPYNTGTKPAVTTTVPVTTVDPNQTFTVIFSYNESGTEYWSVQLVKYGKSAIAPSNPVIAGKTFVGWDKDFSSVTSDMTVTAKFADAGTVSEKNTCTVKFYVDSTLWKTVSVKRGGTVKLTDTPKFTDTTSVFCGWSEDLTNVQSDMTVFAMFKSK